MAETSTMNPEGAAEQCEKKEDVVGIKREGDVLVKYEALECVVCVTRSLDCYDIFATTTASGALLHAFLAKYAQVDLANALNCSKCICKGCFELINVLEQAEIEYVKLKETFEAIINKNPLFDSSGQNADIPPVKAEIDPETNGITCNDVDEDSDDEPLATQSKKKRLKGHKKKKVATSSIKRKVRSKNTVDSWKCSECGEKGTGGDLALTAHKLAAHCIEDSDIVLKDVKAEDSTEGSQETLFNNGLGNLKVELDNFDDDDEDFPDDDDDDYLVETVKPARRPGRPAKSGSISGKAKSKKPKVMHPCDVCDAKYSSLARLEQHKQKHDGSGPPYICEVCGAHYKHKRACDIHVALHKGISDWKCEECNKLFPSKNALARHNNIHTGKLNYQCDLCGKSFIHTSSFKMHKLSHSGLKPHSCDVCGLALMTRSHLKRHKRVHSGEKRHECNVCGKRFSERYNLAAHSKSHESGDTPQPLPLQRRRLFRCTFCPERFERRYMLERHMSGVHGRTLERPPPTPRNTMSKLLKAQAQRRDLPMPTPATDVDTKDDRSSDSRATPITPQKLIAQLSSSTSILASGAWAGSYSAEFGLRHDYPH